MIRNVVIAIGTLALGTLCRVQQLEATTLLYEPFDYAASNFLSATAVGAPNTTTSPIGYLAPNFNNWYGTGIDVGGYQVVNDGQIIDGDLIVPGLYKTSGTTRSLTLGGTGHTFRLSLNSSTQATTNRTGPNVTDTLDPLAGTDPVLQASDTGHTGYYSIALKVTDIANLNLAGGVLLGFNNVIGAQVLNPTTTAAGLTIRPKSGGGAGEFQLGVVKQGSANFANATWDTVNTYTTNSTIFVVGKYQTVGELQPGPTFTTDDIASLWINPASTTFGGYDPPNPLTSTTGDDVQTGPASNQHTLQSFILRQTGTAANSQVPVGVVYDELRVGTNWGDVTPGLPADFNGNGAVDAADFIRSRENGVLLNEVSGRGAVNAVDYGDWIARYGTTLLGNIGGGGSAVPEPAAIVLLAMVASLLGARRGRRA